MNTENLDWLESRNGCSRYALPVDDGEDSESVWLCDECSDEAAPDEGGCPCCDEDEDEEECAA